MKIYLSIGEADFHKTNDDLLKLIPEYIDSQRTRLYIENRKHNSQLTFPEEVDILYCMCLFYTSLTQGDFHDRTLITPKIEYNIGFFSKYKDALVRGLSELNLHDDASFMAKHYKGVKISELNGRKLDARFWNKSYKDKLEPILAEYIKSMKGTLMGMTTHQNGNIDN